MKVFMNKRQGSYSGGLALVAANSAKEAHEILCKSQPDFTYGETLEGHWAEPFTKGCFKVKHWNYEEGNWQEVPNLWYAGVKPCIIAEEGYNE